MELKHDDDISRSETRLHARYSLPDDDALVHLPGTLAPWRIENLSYSGFAARITDPLHGPEQCDEHIQVRLSILDKHHQCHVSKMRVEKDSNRIVFIGAEFEHRRPETLIFLRKFLEPLRWGHSLKSIPQDLRNDRYKGQFWECLRGDGPTDLIYHHQPINVDNQSFHPNLINALLTFPMGRQYGEIKWDHGVLTTSVSTSSEAPSHFQEGALMENLPQLNTDHLRTGLCILLGSPTQTYRHLNPLIHEIRRFLHLESIDEYGDTPISL